VVDQSDGDAAGADRAGGKVTVEGTVTGKAGGEGPSPQEAVGTQTVSPPPPPDDAHSDKAEEPAKQKVATPRELTALARVAAQQGDCKRVATLGAQVKGLDPSYYQRSFATDPDIKRCRK
jgi:hypothetical protein